MIGIMMLETKFPRLPGDIGNPASFAAPPLYRRVRGASVQEVVSNKPVNATLLECFQTTAVKLQRDGATVVGTSCGFLGSMQTEIASTLDIPFLSSSLMLIPLLRKIFGANTVIGVLTFDDSKLGPIHFGERPGQNISIHGLSPKSSYRKTIASDGSSLDRAAARHDSIDVAARCLEQRPDTDIFLIECTNLSPWKKQIRSQFGRPVFDLIDALEWVDKSLPVDQRSDIAEGR